VGQDQRQPPNMLLVRTSSISAFCCCCVETQVWAHHNVAFGISHELGWWVLGWHLRMASASKGAMNLKEKLQKESAAHLSVCITLILRPWAHPNCPQQQQCREEMHQLLFVGLSRSSTAVHLNVSGYEYPMFHPIRLRVASISPFAPLTTPA
jgi:hypothetical protein